MKKMFLIAAFAAAMTVGPGAGAGELPTFEMMGFPITRHQVALMGAQSVQEQSSTPMLSLGGMPASPHQVTVLTPRTRSNANTVMRVPAEFGNESTCVMHAQAHLAGSSIGPGLDPNERVKVLCVRSERPDTSAEH